MTVYSQISPGGSCQVLEFPWQPLDQGSELQDLQTVLLQSETLDGSNQNLVIGLNLQVYNFLQKLKTPL